MNTLPLDVILIIQKYRDEMNQKKRYERCFRKILTVIRMQFDIYSHTAIYFHTRRHEWSMRVLLCDYCHDFVDDDGKHVHKTKCIKNINEYYAFRYYPDHSGISR